MNLIKFQSSISGICFWGVVLLLNDLWYYACALDVWKSALVLVHLPLMANLALLALPPDEVRDYYPLGQKLAPRLQAWHDWAAGRMPCCQRPLCIAITSLYLGLLSLPRATWATQEAAFLGPLELLCEACSFLWPTFTGLSMGFAGCSLLAITAGGLLSCLSGAGGAGRGSGAKKRE
mmetsp:Transcript_48563/g.138814  ORF Transcript_48563/g.138814 Transcript_48563/m.138814 type:complete len:177 (+) Transcript_48563:90-620(+)